MLLNCLKDELVPKPRQKLPNVSSEILEKQHFSTASVACGCGSKTASKKSPPPGLTCCCCWVLVLENPMLLKDELVPKPRQKLPNVSSEILEKQHFSTASVACGCGSKTASKKITSSRAENTMPLKVLLLLVLVLVLVVLDTMLLKRHLISCAKRSKSDHGRKIPCVRS